jgi:hypothetical protein
MWVKVRVVRYERTDVAGFFASRDSFDKEFERIIPSENKVIGVTIEVDWVT